MHIVNDSQLAIVLAIKQAMFDDLKRQEAEKHWFKYDHFYQATENWYYVLDEMVEAYQTKVKAVSGGASDET